MTSKQMDALVAIHLNSVFQFCCYLTGSRLEAEDLSQDTFVKAMELENRFPFDGTEREIRNLFIGIAVNLWRNQQRKRKRRQRIAPVSNIDETEQERLPSSDNVEQEILDRELMDTVRYAVSWLPEKQRVVIHLHYSAGMSLEEIAGVLHIPKQTVKSRLRLAKERLRKNLEVSGYER